jgi:hypothetical protein
LLPLTATNPPSQTVEEVLKYNRHKNDVNGVTPFKPVLAIHNYFLIDFLSHANLGVGKLTINSSDIENEQK